jgi:hypothetical protein
MSALISIFVVKAAHRFQRQLHALDLRICCTYNIMGCSLTCTYHTSFLIGRASTLITLLYEPSNINKDRQSCPWIFHSWCKIYVPYTLPEHLTSPPPPRFSGVRVTRSLVLCVCFVDRCLSFFFLLVIGLSFDWRILITTSGYNNKTIIELNFRIHRDYWFSSSVLKMTFPYKMCSLQCS